MINDILQKDTIKADLGFGVDYYKGEPGKNGEDGKTPIKGVDYFTQAEIQQIEDNVAAKVDLSDYVKSADLSTVATSGSYNDLVDKPTIPAAYELPTASATTLGGVKVGSGLSITNGVLSATGGGTADSVEWDKVQNKPNFANVATSGDYNDLSNKPTIPSTTGLASTKYVDDKVAEIVIPTVPTKVSAFENDAGYLTEHQSLAEYAKKTEIPAPYTLPTASTSTLGGVKVDGNTITIADGVISTKGGVEPDAYIKDASVSGNTLTLTKKDDTEVVFTPSGGSGGGGKEYTFTDGLTETDGTVKWDLGEYITKEVNSLGLVGIKGFPSTTTKVEGKGAIAWGEYSEAAGEYALALGNGVKATGQRTVALGLDSEAADGMAFCHGRGTYGGFCVHAEGKYNIKNYSNEYAHIVGNGTSDTSRSNAYTLDWQGNGTFAGTVSSSTGADYAEYFEWKDGNPNNEDRVGYIVALDGDKIVKANTGDDVLGICSGTAMVLGDSAEWNWNKRYLTDDFGRIIYEDYDIEHEEVKDENTGKVIEEAWTEHIHAPKQNPDYDASRPYVKRADRPEWQIVGMMGKLYVRDNGSCMVNGYANVKDGIATKASGKTNMRVMERVTDNIVRVLMK